MLIPNHPDDERLSALAADDPDVAADVAHVAECARCDAVVADLRALRVSLAGLPDVAPARPLRLLPEVDAPTGDRATGWVRRLFGPVMAAGAALALVGMVGTVGPAWTESRAAGGAAEHQELATDAETTVEPAAAPGLSGEGLRSSGALYGPDDDGVPDAQGDGAPDSAADVPVERSIWPMVLFGGVAVMVAGALLRWILVPRAG